MDKFYCWPDWMPKPQSDGYSYDPVNRRTKTEMEVGSVLRVNFDTDETTVSCSLILDVIQARWFENFEHKMLNQGAQWFQMPIQTGGCIEMHTVRFASRPSATWKAPFYTQYELKLDLWKREIEICPQIMDFLLCVSPTDLRKSADLAGQFWMSLKKLQKPTFIVTELA